MNKLTYSQINEILAKDSNVCPGSTVSDYLKFSPNSLVEYLNNNTDIDWTNCKFYDNEIVVGA